VAHFKAEGRLKGRREVGDSFGLMILFINIALDCLVLNVTVHQVFFPHVAAGSYFRVVIKF
jgi:hypothetical protein